MAQSPVRVRGSPRRRSPSQRERSPARHRSSHTATSRAREKPSSRTRSPKRPKSRSPISSSPVKEKPSSRSRSAKPGSPLPRLPAKEKPSSRARSPKPVSRSPSPRTKRLRRAQAESEAEKMSEKEKERNHGRGTDRVSHRERDSDKEVVQNDRRAHRERDSDKEVVQNDRRERRSGRDAVNDGSTRSRHGQSSSPSDGHRRNRHRSRSPPTVADTRARDEVNNSRGGDRRNDDNDAVAKMAAAEEALEAKEKQKPSFELSGKLAAETNRVRGVTLLFNEPPDARKADIRWRLYVFKAGEVLSEPLYVHRQTAYLFGRERRVADIPTDHPSCSKQHAVLQYRQVDKEQPDGTSLKQPGICTTAREFIWMMVINWLPQFGFLSSRYVGEDLRHLFWSNQHCICAKALARYIGYTWNLLKFPFYDILKLQLDFRTLYLSPSRPSAI